MAALPKTIDPFAQQLADINQRDLTQSDKLEAQRTEQVKPYEEQYQTAVKERGALREQQTVAMTDVANKEAENAKWAETNLPKQKELPDFVPEKIDQHDLQAFSAVITAFALIGSRHTLNPMVAAGNALAGAIEGYSTGNKIKFDEDYKTYKTNFDKAVTNSERELKQYKEILNAKNMDVSSKLRRVELLAQSVGDTKFAMEAATKNIANIDKQIQQKQTHIDKVIQGERTSLQHLETQYETNQRHAEDVDLRLKLGNWAHEDRQQTHVDRVKHENDTIKHWTDQIAKTAKLTVAEEKATANYVTMSVADPAIDELVQKGVTIPAYSEIQQDDNGVISTYSKYGIQTSLSDDQQALLVRSQQFAEGAGHLKSGARINNQTMVIMKALYVPMSYDSESTKTLKSNVRKNDILAAKVAGGRGINAYEVLVNAENPQNVSTPTPDVNTTPASTPSVTPSVTPSAKVETGTDEKGAFHWEYSPDRKVRRKIHG